MNLLNLFQLVSRLYNQIFNSNSNANNAQIECKQYGNDMCALSFRFDGYGKKGVSDFMLKSIQKTNFIFRQIYNLNLFKNKFIVHRSLQHNVISI